MKIALVPQEKQFFILFDRSAHNLVATALAFQELVSDWKDIPRKVEAINNLEHTGDSITHAIATLLHRSFITPLEREDITLMAHTIDDVVDFIHAAVEAMYIYQVEAPTARAGELAAILVKATKEIEMAMPLMHQRAEAHRVLETCIEINRLENEGDRSYRQALAEIFDTGRDATYIIKWREIYEHMESAIDRCEDVANILEGIALKAA
ncbi:MAG: DUF47 domain-containing protein [Dehalococcoidia bacterium]|nr:MAG: DUF47 domain-containing protein [Dehalococcoidia bacterium]